MKKHNLYRLAALLAAALLLALPLARADEIPEVENQFVDRLPEESGDIALDVAIDPLVPPATEAGDTGLWVEYDPQTDQAGVELGEIDLPTGDWNPAQTDRPSDEEARSDVLPAEDDALADGEGMQVRGLGVTARTREQIQAFADAHPSYVAQVNIYSVAPKDDPYTLGYLSDVNQRSALNLVNQVRYIAGLPGNLTLMPEREEMEAATSLVLRLYGALSHYPPRADALSDRSYDALYNLGYSGASRSNIAMGYNVTNAILAYMADSDSENIGKVGHRRWILNPALGKTVMGANGRFSAMYVYDQSGASTKTRVAWPAQQMPVQYFSAEDPWSVSFGELLDPSQIEVELVRQWDGRTWRFSEAKSDGFFVVNNQAYAQRGCVIFRPDNLDGILIGDAFDVSITDGEKGVITRYTVNFFSLDTAAAAPLSRPEVTALKTDAGNVIRWNAVERAIGYYVCRRNAQDDTGYAIVADVKGETSYVDRAVDGDQVYYYQVYPHTRCVTCPLVSGVKATAPQPSKVKLSSGKSAKLYLDDKLQLQAILDPVYAETGLFWSSTSEYVAVVDQNGLVKPKHRGVTTVSVTTDNGKKAKVKIRVLPRPKPTGVALNRKHTICLYPGDTLKLEATLTPSDAVSKLRWRSTDSKVVRPYSDGTIEALKVGRATITVKTSNHLKAQVKVAVLDPSKPTKVKLDKTGTIEMKKGEKLTLNATISPKTAVSKLSWSSLDRRVASVSSKGVVKALKAGTTTITVRTSNGLKARVKVKVTK